MTPASPTAITADSTTAATPESNIRRRLLQTGLAAGVAGAGSGAGFGLGLGVVGAVLPARSWAQGAAASGNGKALMPVRFATNWKAQAAHGGFYQAVADGTYRALGLDVTIVQGGPSVNNRPLLPAGRIDFLMTGNLLHSFDNVRNRIPTVVVAAMFQKDPQALMAHPGQGYERFEALRSAPTLWIAKDAQFTWWQWLKAVHGFRDEQLKPYNYNLGPWLAQPRSVQQGYAVAEPLYARQQGGFQPVVHLLADHGFSTYSTLIETRRETAEREPEKVRRFVEGSIQGWKRYLQGDPSPAHALMRRENPDMGEAELEASRALIRSQGLVESGDALKMGIGAMRRERVADFLEQMVRAGLFKPGQVDPERVMTDAFLPKA